MRTDGELWLPLIARHWDQHTPIPWTVQKSPCPLELGILQLIHFLTPMLESLPKLKM
jgi:hypothetical protein